MNSISTNDASDLKRLEGVIRRGKRAFIEVGNALREVKERQLYKSTHRSFEKYVEERFAFKRHYALNLIEAANVAENVDNCQQIETESQAREVAKAPPEQQQGVVDRAVEIAEERGKKPTAAIIKEARGEVVPHVARSSGENEWYTPPKYIELANRVMGGIDLDPASSDAAQNTVQAGSYYTLESDGLSRPWFGNVWLNPPYSADLIGAFTERLAEHVESNAIAQAILLVNNASDTRWFQRCGKLADAFCFVGGRIRFLDTSGTPANTPLQGQTFLYFGSHGGRFRQAFAEVGIVAVPACEVAA